MLDNQIERVAEVEARLDSIEERLEQIKQYRQIEKDGPVYIIEKTYGILNIWYS